MYFEFSDTCISPLYGQLLTPSRREYASTLVSTITKQLKTASSTVRRLHCPPCRLLHLQTDPRSPATGTRPHSSLLSMSCTNGTSIPRWRSGRRLRKALECALLRPAFFQCWVAKCCRVRCYRETKTVNSWFQNKRASTKKRSMTVKPSPHEAGRVVVPRPSNSASSSSTPRPSESGDHADLDDIQRPGPRILPEDVPPRASHPSLDLDRAVYSDVGVARRVRPPPRASSEYPDEYSSKRLIPDAGSGVRTAGAMPADLCVVSLSPTF